MAWTTPRTWTTGELVTKTILDTHIRDNLNALRDLNPNARLSKTVALSVATGAFPTWVNVTGSWVEDFDNDNMGDVANDRLVVQTAGKYLIGYGLQFAANTTGSRGARMMVAAAAVNATNHSNATTTAGAWFASGSALVNITASQAITLQAAQNSGGALNVTDAYMWATRISS